MTILKTFQAEAAGGGNDKPLSARLQAVLDGPYADIRNQARAFIARPQMAPVPADLSKEQYRAITLDRIKDMIAAGFTRLPYNPKSGGGGKIAESINVGEIIAHADLSLAVKQGVQFGLFGTSIERLGTEKHQGLIEEVITGKLLGGFAMTEENCGSDVQGTQTEAIYDHKTRSFTINTPNESARKTFIGNAALHGRMMVVFAQLKMSADAKESEGVHAFLVPVREKDGTPKPGILIGDNGHKVGLNGVDNGTIEFENVKIPYDALLDKFGGIDQKGAYKSDIEKKTARFFKMIGTLVTGRVFVGMAALSANKTALAAAVPRAINRTVFGHSLMNMQSAQTRLLPRIAEAYALHFATRKVLAAFESGDERVETMAAAIKAYSSDESFKSVDELSLLAGGAGFMSKERYGELRASMAVYRTFEGDNTVLRFLVTKNQGSRLASKFRNVSTLGMFVKDQAMRRKDRLARRAADRKYSQDFLDPESQKGIFQGRERAMMHKLAQKGDKLDRIIMAGPEKTVMKIAKACAEQDKNRPLGECVQDIVAKLKDDPAVQALDMDHPYVVLALECSAEWLLDRKNRQDLRKKTVIPNLCQNDMRAYADAYAERWMMKCFADAVSEQTDPEVKAVLKDVCDLFAIQAIMKHKDWYLENGHLDAGASHALDRIELDLQAKLRKHAQTLVDAFGIPEQLLKGVQPAVATRFRKDPAPVNP